MPEAARKSVQLALIAGLCLFAAIGLGFLWISRFDVSVRADGSLISRDKVTGRLEICTPANECRELPRRIKNDDPLWVTMLDLTEAQIEREKYGHLWDAKRVAASDAKIAALRASVERLIKSTN